MEMTGTKDYGTGLWEKFDQSGPELRLSQKISLSSEDIEKDTRCGLKNSTKSKWDLYWRTDCKHKKIRLPTPRQFKGSDKRNVEVWGSMEASSNFIGIHVYVGPPHSSLYLYPYHSLYSEWFCICFLFSLTTIAISKHTRCATSIDTYYALKKWFDFCERGLNYPHLIQKNCSFKFKGLAYE